MNSTGDSIIYRQCNLPIYELTNLRISQIQNAKTLNYLARAFDVHRSDAGRQADSVRSVAVVESLVPRIEEEATTGGFDSGVPRPFRSCRGSGRVRAREWRACRRHFRVV